MITRAALPVEVDVRHDQFLRAVEVPSVAGRRLVVPGERAVVGMDRDDRCRVELVAALTAVEVHVVGRRVAGADVHELKRGS